MKCFYCERDTIASSMLPEERRRQEGSGLVRTRDHKRTKLMGGGLASDNVVIACSRCNCLRGHVPFEAFYRFAIEVIRRNPSAGTTSLKIALTTFVDALVLSAMRNPDYVVAAIAAARLNGLKKREDEAA